MSEDMKNFRKTMRDIPQDYITESKHDELLARETDETKANFGKLTHSIWDKPA
jgi:hypothetical protein